ncbi:hypothetical protein J1G42_12830 [Cellulomonas sp. zg-ZUI222]|uniref:hypothetical protein n=1 Tax=Cellulomonas wangleii TaxID=2816956 RepID=UPI001A94505C|nr:hypothetical protein [Cellulomonas wangleii]MBO0921709.1 hypothetical protein [Cellulomonas wangleii]
MVDAYYADTVRAGTAARSRAQAAQSTTVAVAALLAASVAVADLASSTVLVRAFALASIGTWLASALLFSRAATREPAKLDSRGDNDDDSIVRIILNHSSRDRQDIDRLITRGNLTSIAACALSLSTVGLLVFAPMGTTNEAVTVSLTAAAKATAEEACGARLPQILRGRTFSSDSPAPGQNSTQRIEITCPNGSPLSLPLDPSSIKSEVRHGS